MGLKRPRKQGETAFLRSKMLHYEAYLSLVVQLNAIFKRKVFNEFESGEWDGQIC